MEMQLKKKWGESAQKVRRGAADERTICRRQCGSQHGPPEGQAVHSKLLTGTHATFRGDSGMNLDSRIRRTD